MTVGVDGNLSKSLLCLLGGAAISLADVTERQRHVLQGEIAEKNRNGRKVELVLTEESETLVGLQI